MIGSRSLRWQLQSYYAILLLLTLGTLTGFSIHWMRQSEQHRYDSLLREYQHKLMPLLRRPTTQHPNEWKLYESLNSEREGSRRTPPDGGSGPRRGPPGGPPDSSIEPLLTDGWYLGMFDFERIPRRLTRTFPKDIDLSFEMPSEKGDFIIEDAYYRSLIHREPGRLISIIGYPKLQLGSYMQKRQWGIIGISSVIFFIATATGWFIIQRALQPITAIRETANDIAQGKLAVRIDEASQQENEIGTLSKNLNQTFDQLESMFERQKRFTSEASHELRTPIAVILGYCQLALEKDRSPEQIRDAIQACRRAGERMKNLTNDLLELSRIESGEINFEFTACPVKEVAEEALELIEPLAAEKGVILHDEIEDVTIKANNDRLWQVLVNLLSNAIRHTPKGNSVTLKSSVKNSQVEISVCDQGEGIPAQDLPHIFGRFYRVDSSRNRKTGGSGLGLAISETIIKAHQGSIHVESRERAGTTFTIRLPV